jgi:hypothetical protein
VAQLAVDHNFDARIAEGLLRREPSLDLMHIRDVDLAAAPDPVVLRWAAEHGRVLLTHDRATLVGFAYERVVQSEPMSGVIAVSAQCPIGRAIDEILLLVTCTPDEEWPGRVVFVPL